MPTFQDRTGQPHAIAIRFKTVERLRDEMGIDISQPETLREIGKNDLTCCRLLWISSDSSFPFKDFASQQNLQTLQDGLAAFMLELFEVLPSSQAQPLREAWEQSRQEQEEQFTQAIRFLEIA